MKTVEKKVVQSHGLDRAPLCGFITYVDPRRPVLLRRIGWEVSNDVHDDFADAISTDNGRTWGPPRAVMASTPVEGGVIVHTENAALYLPERNLLIHWTNDKFEAGLQGGVSLDSGHRVRVTAGEPGAVSAGAAHSFAPDLGMKQGTCVSFATPLRDSRGRPLLPVMWQKEDPTGAAIGCGYPMRSDMPNVFQNIWEVGLLIGEFAADGSLAWHVSRAVPDRRGDSSRGMMEGTIAELADGRFVMVLRGCNLGWPDKPGYKWLTFSSDRGETWSLPTPLGCDDGGLIESSSTGSALFRSAAGKLYWIGNLCLEGRRPEGNMPRSPLYIAEMQEEPVAIKGKTITVIARTELAAGEHPDTQHSNFKVCQDRETGDLMVLFTRYGERGYAENAWIRADLYQYRVALEE